MVTKQDRVIRRKNSIRKRLLSTTKRSYRLIFHKSNSHISSQIVDISNGNCIAAASSMEKSLRSLVSSNCNKDYAKKVGFLISTRASEKSIKSVVFDRGSCKYHGVVKAFCDAARSYLVF